MMGTLRMRGTSRTVGRNGRLEPESPVAVSADSESRNSFRKEVGNRLRYLRNRAGKSVDEVASTVGVSGATIRLWESGKHSPAAESIKDLCDTFGVSSDWLLRRTGMDRLWLVDHRAVSDQLASTSSDDKCWKKAIAMPIDLETRPNEDFDEVLEIIRSVDRRLEQLGSDGDALTQ